MMVDRSKTMEKPGDDFGWPLLALAQFLLNAAINAFELLFNKFLGRIYEIIPLYQPPGA